MPPYHCLKIQGVPRVFVFGGEKGGRRSVTAVLASTQLESIAAKGGQFQTNFRSGTQTPVPFSIDADEGSVSNLLPVNFIRLYDSDEVEWAEEPELYNPDPYLATLGRHLLFSINLDIRNPRNIKDMMISARLLSGSKLLQDIPVSIVWVWESELKTHLANDPAAIQACFAEFGGDDVKLDTVEAVKAHIMKMINDEALSSDDRTQVAEDVQQFSIDQPQDIAQSREAASTILKKIVVPMAHAAGQEGIAAFERFAEDQKE